MDVGLFISLKLSICDSGCVAGGESTYDNCQILQTRVNRYKSDKDNVDPTQLKGYSCDVKFTGMFAPFSILDPKFEMNVLLH